METENLLKQLKAVSKWSTNLQQSLESVDAELDQEEKEALASISSLILKKAKVVHQALGGGDGTNQGTSSEDSQKRVSELQNEVERLNKANNQLEEAQKRAHRELADLHIQLDELRIQKQSMTREEYEKESMTELNEKLAKSEAKCDQVQKALDDCERSLQKTMDERERSQMRCLQMERMVEALQQQVLMIEQQSQELRLKVRMKAQEIESLQAKIEEIQNNNPEA